MESVVKLIEEMFSQVSGMPVGSFVVSFDPYLKPTHLAAIAPTQALRDAGHEVLTPIVFISRRLIDLLRTDDQLRFVLRHEYFHQVSTGKIEVAVETDLKQRHGYAWAQEVSRQRRQIQETGSKGTEFFSDVMALKAGLMAGEDPMAADQVMDILAELHGRDPQSVLDYLRATHPDFTDRLNALQHTRDRFKNDKKIYHFDRRNVRSARVHLDALDAVFQTPQYVAEILRTYRIDVANQIALRHLLIDSLTFKRLELLGIANLLIFHSRGDDLNGDDLAPQQRAIENAFIGEVAASHRAMEQKLATLVRGKLRLDERTYLDSRLSAVRSSLVEVGPPAAVSVEAVDKIRGMNLDRYHTEFRVWAVSMKDLVAKQANFDDGVRAVIEATDRVMLESLLAIPAELGLEMLHTPGDKREQLPQAQISHLMTSREDLTDLIVHYIQAEPDIVMNPQLLQARRSVGWNPGYKPERVAAAIEAAAAKLSPADVTVSQIATLFHNAKGIGFSLAPFVPLVNGVYSSKLVAGSLIDGAPTLVELYRTVPEVVRPTILKAIRRLVPVMIEAQAAPKRLLRSLRPEFAAGDATRLANQLIVAYHAIDQDRDLRGKLPEFDQVRGVFEHDQSRYDDLLGLDDERFVEMTKAEVIKFLEFTQGRAPGETKLLAAYREILRARLSRIGKRVTPWQTPNPRPHFDLGDKLSYALFVDGDSRVRAKVASIAGPLIVTAFSFANTPRSWSIFTRVMASIADLRRVYFTTADRLTGDDWTRDSLSLDILRTIERQFDPILKVEEVIQAPGRPATKYRAVARLKVDLSRPEFVRRLLTNSITPGFERLPFADDDEVDAFADALSTVYRDRQSQFSGRMIDESLRASLSVLKSVDDARLVRMIRRESLEILRASIVGDALLAELKRRLPRMSLAKKTDLVADGSLGLMKGGFITKEILNTLLVEIEASTEDLEGKLKYVAKLTPHLSSQQQEAAWKFLAPAYLYQDAELNESKAHRLIEVVYGNYLDGKFGKVNEISEHFALDESQAKSLNRRIFSREDEMNVYRTAEIINAAIKPLVGTPEKNLAMILWLSGKIQDPPEIASKVVEAITHRSDRDAAIKSYTKSMTLDRLRGTYQNSPIGVRIAIISDLVTDNNQKGLMASPEGRRIYVDSVTDGLEAKNIPLARCLLSAFLDALGKEAHVFATQSLASAVRKSSEDDVERLKEGIAAKGALFVKILQGLYMDPYLIPDRRTREKFRSVLDDVGNPLRQDLLSMTREAMRGEYAKVKTVRAIKTGSINTTASVEFKDGTSAVARMVKGDPDNVTRFDMEVIQRMIPILNEKARGADHELASVLRKVANGMDEFLTGIAEKIYTEVDLSRESKRAKMLRWSYTTFWPTGLNTRVKLVSPLDTTVRFSSDPDRDLADPARIVFYPRIHDVSDQLDASESLRVRRTILRTEWKAIFRRGSFDPDGHFGNWLVERAPQGRLNLFRIDYSQADSISRSSRRQLRGFLNFMFNESYPQAAFRRNALRRKAFKNFLGLLMPVGDTTALRASFDRHVAALIERKVSPIEALVELQALLKSDFDGKLAFRPEIRYVLKSLFTTYGALNPRVPEERAMLTEDFMRIVLGRGWIISKLAGRTQLKEIVSESPEAVAEAAQVERFDRLREAVQVANREHRAMPEALQWELHDAMANQAERSQKLEPLLREYVKFGGDATLFGRVRDGYGTDAPGFQGLVEDILRDGNANPRMLAARFVATQEIRHLYKMAAATYAENPSMFQELNPEGFTTREFREIFEVALIARADSSSIPDMVKLDPKRFPRLHAELPRLVLDRPTIENIAAFLESRKVSIEAQRPVVKSLVEAHRRLAGGDGDFELPPWLDHLRERRKVLAQNGVLDLVERLDDLFTEAIRHDFRIESALRSFEQTSREPARGTAVVDFHRHFEDMLDGEPHGDWPKPLTHAELAWALRKVQRLHAFTGYQREYVTEFVSSVARNHRCPPGSLQILRRMFDLAQRPGSVKGFNFEPPLRQLIEEGIFRESTRRATRAGRVRDILIDRTANRSQRRMRLAALPLGRDEALSLLDILDDRYLSQLPFGGFALAEALDDLVFTDRTAEVEFLQALRPHVEDFLRPAFHDGGTREKARYRVDYLIAKIDARLARPTEALEHLAESPAENCQISLTSG